MDVHLQPASILSSLLDPKLDPLFWRPARLGYDSAWTAHVPFAHWIVGALRPRMLVELGTHNGVSYAAFCEAVVQSRLATRCFAVDTWVGDEHAGHYGEDVYEDLKRFHDQHYAAFSEMLRCTFDAALEYMPDGAIDLLHIDGCHGYDAVRHDFESWRPKLSDRAVVVMHDSNVRERDFGVWKLFEELRDRHPSFEFLHEHGLAVLAVGANVPPDVAGLCALSDPAMIGAVRERFSQLGERWRFEVHTRVLSHELHLRNLQQAALEAERDAVRRAGADAARMRARSAQRAAEARQAASIAYQEADRLTTQAKTAREAIDRLSMELHVARVAAVPGQAAVTEAARLRLELTQRVAESEIVQQDAARHRAEAERLRQECLRLAAERDAWAEAQYAASLAAADTVAALQTQIAALQARMAGLQQSLEWRLGRRLSALGRRVPRRLRAGVSLTGRMIGWAARLRLRDGLRRRAQLRRDLRLLAASPLFDGGWYLARYPDVAASGSDPAVHFLTRGAAERRHPSAQFDSVWYQQTYPDIAASGQNPLLHYLSHGAAEGRWIMPLADRRLPASPPPAPPVMPVRPVLLPPDLGPPSGPVALPAPLPPSAALAPAPAPIRMVFLSGEPDTPGHVYRVDRAARAARRLGAGVQCFPVSEAAARRDEIAASDVVVIWRAAWSPDVLAAIEAARESGARLVFDVDDLMVEPDIATIALIDGIRTQFLPEDAVRGHYTRVRDTMVNADFCIGSTEELAAHMRRHAKPTFVLPNGFDRETFRMSRHLARQRRQSAADGLIRIGYAVGSRTHQRDFSLAAGAVGRILRDVPQARFVVFTSHLDGLPLLNLDEFPALAGLEAQLEWRMTVPLERLPEEIARFDVNLAPLEVGNPFCEAKSELKFFEAALVDVVTIASPTGPYRRAIDHGRTGFLASTPEDWYAALQRVVGNPRLARQMARAACRDVQWTFGPERRVEMMASILDQIGGGAAGAWAFALDAHRAMQPRQAPEVPETTTLFESDALGDADVTVIVPLYNYARHIEEALESVRLQSLAVLDLVVVDDCSTDASVPVVLDWVQRHAARFNRVAVLRNRANAGLGLTRNAGFAAAETPYVLPLDADNRLLPACCETLLAQAESSGAAFVYPVIAQIGAGGEAMGTLPYVPARLIGVPYIDAMALVSVAAWSGVGGYWAGRLGWEDYDFWCRIAEYGLNGCQAPGSPLAEYRVHDGSMLRAITESDQHKPQVMADIVRRHPWLSLVAARINPPTTPLARADLANIEALLPLLRCPETGQALYLEEAENCLCSEDGSRRWPIVAGRPVLFSGMLTPREAPEAHLSAPLPERALAIMRDADAPVLNLGAGATAERLPHVVEVDAAIFRNTGVVADAHRLPFADAAFAAVVVVNAFEHYRDPRAVAAEIFRVLRPGGRVLVQAAFLQPLRDAPAHYFNYTRYGLEAIFADFATERLHVPPSSDAAHALALLAHEARAALARAGSADAASGLSQTPLGHLADLWADPAARDGDAAWQGLKNLPQQAQDVIAAGFEYVGRRPPG